MYRNPTDNIYSAPATCLYKKLSEDQEMHLRILTEFTYFGINLCSF